MHVALAAGRDEPSVVGAEIDTPDASAVPQDGSDGQAGLGVPYSCRTVIACRDGETSVRRETDEPKAICMLQRRCHWCAGIRIPDPPGPVEANGGDSFAVWTEGGMQHVVRMPQIEEMAPRGCVPDHGGARADVRSVAPIQCRGHHTFTIGAKLGILRI